MLRWQLPRNLKDWQNHSAQQRGGLKDSIKNPPELLEKRHNTLIIFIGKKHSKQDESDLLSQLFCKVNLKSPLKRILGFTKCGGLSFTLRFCTLMNDIQKHIYSLVSGDSSGHSAFKDSKKLFVRI